MVAVTDTIHVIYIRIKVLLQLTVLHHVGMRAKLMNTDKIESAIKNDVFFLSCSIFFTRCISGYFYRKYLKEILLFYNFIVIVP